MPNEDDETRAKLAEWYGALLPRRVDIVGDFGGKQLFLIDGDSLLIHSVATSAVDYDGNMQPLLPCRHVYSSSIVLLLMSS